MAQYQAKELTSADKYEFVSGADQDGGHLHGDLDRILVTGAVLPYRASMGGGAAARRVMGEDVAYLLEWGALRSCAISELWYFAQGGSFAKAAYFAAASRTFSRKLLGTQAYAAAFDPFLTTSGGKGVLRPFVKTSALPSTSRLIEDEFATALPSDLFATKTDFQLDDERIEGIRSLGAGSPLLFAPIDKAFVMAAIGTTCGVNPCHWTWGGGGIVTAGTSGDLAGYVPASSMAGTMRQVLVLRRYKYYKLDGGSYKYQPGLDVVETREEIGGRWSDEEAYAGSWGQFAGEAPETGIWEDNVPPAGETGFWRRVISGVYRRFCRSSPASETVILRVKTRHARAVKAVCLFWVYDDDSASDDPFKATVVRTVDMVASDDQTWDLKGSQMPGVEDLMADAGFAPEDEKESDYDFRVKLGVYPLVYFDDHTALW